MYSLYYREFLMKTAKLFRNGQSQAVRLPKEFRFEGDFVYIKKSGNAIVLLPAKGVWSALVESLDRFSDDFMTERDQPKAQKREAL
jgi:antitoxin VapB